MIRAAGYSARIAVIASTPSTSGICRSINVTSGRVPPKLSMASPPFIASPRHSPMIGTPHPHHRVVDAATVVTNSYAQLRAAIDDFCLDFCGSCVTIGIIERFMDNAKNLLANDRHDRPLDTLDDQVERNGIF